MKVSPFLKNAFWVAPLGLALAWATPRKTSTIKAKSPAIKEAPAKQTIRSFPTSASDLPSELLSVADVKKALVDLEGKSDLHPLMARALRDRALRTWLDLDPASALIYAEENVTPWGESFGKELFRVWLDLDPDSALEGFSLASPALRDSVFKSFFTHFADLDPVRVIDLMNGNQWKRTDSTFDPRGDVFRHAYGKWAEINPRAAAEHYRENLASHNLVRYSSWPMTSIFQAWGESDPLAAWKYYQDIDINMGTDKHGTTGLELMQIEAALARSVLTQNPDLIDEFEISPSKATEMWVEADLQGALDFAESLPKDHLWRGHLLANAAMRLATTDPARALDLFLEGQNSSAAGIQGGFTDTFYHENFQMLNAQDPDRAHELLQSVPEQQRALALGGIIAQEFASDSQSAILKIQEFYQDPDTSRFMDRALARSIGWTEQNPTEIISAVPAARSLVKGALLDNWTRKDPESAAAFLVEEMNANPDYQLQSDEALSRIAAARPEFTAEWLHSLPEGPVQNDAVFALSANWSTFDRPAAENWIATLPAGPLKNIAVDALTPESK